MKVIFVEIPGPQKDCSTGGVGAEGPNEVSLFGHASRASHGRPYLQVGSSSSCSTSPSHTSQHSSSNTIKSYLTL